ncbi:hypothetical protein [Corynebacterium nuruki]|uniref:hypothetical protein n=1 Tax=Corynebacterium nuruki TaxID=1032851 RepID=UPI0039BFB53C
METIDTLITHPDRLVAAAGTAFEIAARLSVRPEAAAAVLPPVVPAAGRFCAALTGARHRQSEAVDRFAGFYRRSATALTGLAGTVTDHEATTAAGFHGIR